MDDQTLYREKLTSAIKDKNGKLKSNRLTDRYFPGWQKRA